MPISLTRAHWRQFNHVCWNLKHVCIYTPTIIGSDNGLSPERYQAIIWTNAGILLIRTLGTIFSEILGKIHTFSFNKMHLKTSVKWQPFFLGINTCVKIIFGKKMCIKNLPSDEWPLKLTGDKSTLVQIMVLCHQATSHYLSQYWPRSILPHGITRPQLGRSKE